VLVEITQTLSFTLNSTEKQVPPLSVKVLGAQGCSAFSLSVLISDISRSHLVTHSL
jgi:hypothetical protein